MDKILNILHLEDNPNDAELVSAALRSQGIKGRVTRVDSQKAFTEHIERGGFDLVLSDYSLPGFNGLAALRILRESHPDLPFIFVTGTLGEEIAIESLKQGVNDYVLKDGLNRLSPSIMRALKEVELLAKRRHAEKLLAEAQHLAHLGAWEMDLATQGIGWSDELFRIFGTDPKTFQPTWGAVLECIHPNDRSLVKQSVEESVAKRKPFSLDYRISRADGSVRTVHARGHVVLGRDGVPVKLVGTAQDITERRSLEQQLHQSQKMEAVGRLAGGVAHDFNNILTVIIGYSDFLLDNMKEEELRTDLMEIKKGGERAASLTRQLLAFSRRQVLQPRLLNLNVVINDIEKMLQRLMGEDIEYLSVLAPALGKVRVDPGQIEQVIMNLAVNARDAMAHGGKLTIETANVTLNEQYAQDHEAAIPPGPYVMMAVSDTGSGMTPETKAHLFEPFFTTKEHGKGTGLGLSMVYGIVKQSGGFVWAYSEVGLGSTFKIYLPQVTEAGDLAAPAGQAVSASMAGSETILLVEDEPAIRKLIALTLKKNGYKVLQATRGAEAVSLSGQFKEPIHMLLTDVVMPQMNGPELAAQLSPLRPDMRVLYMSGFTDHAVLDHRLLSQKAIFLQKPFTPETLARKVRDVLDAPAGPGG